MKKIIILFFGVLLFSCSSDTSDGLTITPQRLLGKWYLKGGTVNGGTFTAHVNSCPSSRDFQEFFNTGKLVFNGHDATCVLNDTQTSDWVLNGNILTVSNENFDPMIYQYVYLVEYLSDDELLLKQTVTEQNITTTYRISFTRN